ncbi:hypothetical protein BJX66DRAFT_340531 [Aspergillus keveii]|uniref:Cyanovirin-N domain-containing protein n=1 Tax=Aspergillus keveii TaxID=714993 RepID=A0ABR4FXZ3_9EURO
MRASILTCTSALLLGAASATNNLASVLLCHDTSGKCGYYFEYNGAGGLQEIRYTASGSGCAGAAAFEHTNSAGFWERVAILPPYDCGGVAMGFNPTGKEICLEDATYRNSDRGYLAARCRNEFGGEWDLNESSVEEVFQGVGDILV